MAHGWPHHPPSVLLGPSDGLLFDLNCRDRSSIQGFLRRDYDDSAYRYQPSLELSSHSSDNGLGDGPISTTNVVNIMASSGE